MIHSIGDGIAIEGVADNPGLIEARSIIRRAHELGDAEATNNYAVILRNGYGGPADVEQADRLIVEAANAGSVGANTTLSRWALEGLGNREPDPEQARAYMRSAADTGDGYAHWQYAMMVLQGVGAEADPQEAYRWIISASDRGETNAMVSRGVMLATGEGVPEDDAAARDWYRRAAESGNIGFDAGLKSLGYMLITGEGGEPDRSRGYGYILVAAAEGNNEAEALRDHFVEQLTDDEIDGAFELAQE